MPKGVMWRHEDVFFAGLQGGNPGGPDITEPGRLGPAARERTAAPTTLPVAPLMHGNGPLGVDDRHARRRQSRPRTEATP